MTDEERQQLRAEWQENEAELERLRDLPTGSLDPIKRYEDLLVRQDEIEYELGLKALNDSRVGRPARKFLSLGP
jgi:hypothetical protein